MSVSLFVHRIAKTTSAALVGARSITTSYNSVACFESLNFNDTGKVYRTAIEALYKETAWACNRLLAEINSDNLTKVESTYLAQACYDKVAREFKTASKEEQAELYILLGKAKCFIPKESRDLVSSIATAYEVFASVRTGRLA